MPKIVKVFWLDILHCGDDISREEAQELKPELMITYGELISQNEDRIVVTSTTCPRSEVRCVTVIPWCCVKGVKQLEEKEL